MSLAFFESLHFFRSSPLFLYFLYFKTSNSRALAVLLDLLEA